MLRCEQLLLLRIYYYVNTENNTNFVNILTFAGPLLIFI